MSFYICLENDRSFIPDAFRPDRAAPCCPCCGEELNEEEREYPQKDEVGDNICDRCYRDKYEGECDRCGYLVEKSELKMRPGELLALWQKVQGLKPGYYRVLHWPLYADGMISMHLFHDALEFFSPLDSKGLSAAEGAWTPGGCLCAECRKQIEREGLKP